MAVQQTPAINAGNSEAAGGNRLPAESVAPKPDMAKIAKALNQAPSSIGRNLKFKVDLDRGTSVIQVLDRDTGEIIRQIPPEKVSTYLQSEGGLALRLYGRDCVSRRLRQAGTLLVSRYR